MKNLFGEEQNLPERKKGKKKKEKQKKLIDQGNGSVLVWSDEMNKWVHKSSKKLFSG